jgi:hypothetical protein
MPALSRDRSGCLACRCADHRPLQQLLSVPTKSSAEKGIETIKTHALNAKVEDHSET